MNNKCHICEKVFLSINDGIMLVSKWRSMICGQLTSAELTWITNFEHLQIRNLSDILYLKHLYFVTISLVRYNSHWDHSLIRIQSISYWKAGPWTTIVGPARAALEPEEPLGRGYGPDGQALFQSFSRFFLVSVAQCAGESKNLGGLQVQLRMGGWRMSWVDVEDWEALCKHRGSIKSLLERNGRLHVRA